MGKDTRRRAAANASLDRALARNGSQRVGRLGDEASGQGRGGTPGEPSAKAALGVGIIILCAISAVLGSCVSNADEPSTVTVVEEIRIPVTDVKTVTVQPKANEVLSPACARIIAAAEQQRLAYQKLSATVAKFTKLIDDAGKVMYTDDPNQLSELDTQWRQLQRDQIAAWEQIGTADQAIATNLPDCRR